MRIYPVKESEKLTGFDMFVEMTEALTSLGGNITRKDVEGMGANIMEIMQECINIANKYDIDLRKESIMHQAKMLNSKLNFIRQGVDINE